MSDTGGRDETSPAVYHGGNLAVARRLFPDAAAPWVDLSTGINPVPYPVGTLDADAWTRLPGAGDTAALEATAARLYGAGDPLTVVAGPGTQALIQWLPRILPARRVGILGFTYQEHAEVWRTAGASVETVAAPTDLAGFDVAVVVNPNNPDGRLVDVAALAALAGRLVARGGSLVVDEAFMDVLPGGSSLVPHLPANAVVLRSFGKTWGLAGLRLGFAIAAAPIAGRLRKALGPWAISGTAIAIGTTALADHRWLAATCTRLAADAARLDDLLTGAGLDLVGGTPLYRLVEVPAAADWFDRLGRRGILVRPFPARPDWLRFGLPGTADAWVRLEAALGRVAAR